MLNPNDIASKRFDKSALGYKADEVETFLDRVAQEYAQVLREKTDLERKIDVLADKLEEYRRDEESLKSAVFEAQKLGSSLVREAKIKAEHIVQEANEQAHGITTEATTRADALMNETNKRLEDTQRSAEQNLQQQEAAFERLKSEVAGFKKRMMSTYKAHIELISQLPDIIRRPETPVPPPAEKPEEVAPYNPVASRPEAEPPAAAAAPAPEQAAEPVRQAAAEPAPPEPEPEEEPEPEIVYEQPVPEYEPEAEPEEQDPAPALSFEEREQPTRELPPVRTEKRFGALKFGDNYSIEQEAETPKRGRRSRK